MTTRTRPGVHVSLLGIDGIGKTTLAKELAGLLEAAGRHVRIMSWRRYIERPNEDPIQSRFPLEALQHLWVESFRLYFGGAHSSDGNIALPRSYDELNQAGGTEYLKGAALEAMHGSGPFASAWIELAANTILHMNVIDPLVEQGYVVIHESFGYKHLLKLFLFSEHLAHHMSVGTEVGHRFVRQYFGRFLRPDIGIYVAGDPRLAFKWRQQQSGGVGTFESYLAAGADAKESFLKLQQALTHEFESFTQEYGWLRVEVEDVPREHNHARIIEALSADPAANVLGLRPASLIE